MSEAATAPKHVFLIDGSGFIFRAFHALPPMTRPDGTPVNAVYGFTNMLMKLMEDTDADHIAVIFDAARKTFRSDIYPAYKAQRPPPPEDLVPQFDLIKALVEAFNVPSVQMDGYEADDLIATYARLARERGADVTIVSSDKDLMQLVTDKVTMLDTMKNVEIGPEGVVAKFGVGPDKVVEVQALSGDSVDNVPGVPGIGIKTAAQLILEYGDLETLLARAPEIKQTKRRENLIEFAEQARISRRLVQLKNDVPVDRDLDSFALQDLDVDRVTAFLREQGFKSVVARIESRHGAAPSTVAAPKAEAAYELVQDEAALSRWIAAAVREGQVAFDTETTGLDAIRAELVGVSMSVAPGSACYVPLAHISAKEQGAFDLGDGGGSAGEEAPVQIPRDRAIELLKPMLEDPSVLKIGHNIKYDALLLLRYGIDITPVDDTMLLSFVLDGGVHGHGMDELAELHLGHTCIAFKDVAGSGRNQITFDYVPLKAACDYAAEDADITLQLHRMLKPRLIEDRMTTLYETIERPLVPVVSKMEREGVLVDPEALRGLSRDFATRMAALEIEIHELAGEKFNIGSPKQLGEILFDKMSLPGGKKTKTGAYSTDARVLEDLAAEGHDLPVRIVSWRQLSKLKSTYADSLVEQINPETGRIHTSYAMTGAQTGRMSSTDPNLQNIPIRTEEGRRIRQTFIAAPGRKLLSLDYSQIELRVLAHIAGIETLVQAFRDGLDIHAMTASEMFGVPIEGMDPIVRRNAKAINFGIIYGISPFGLARQLSIPQGEAKSYIEAYFERFPGIRDYMEAAREECRAHGYVTTLFGRRIHLPMINDKNPMRRNYAERQAINAPVQGSAADIIKRAMIRVPAALQAAKLDALMLLQVHDELLFEVPEAQMDETAKIVGAVMEKATEPGLALKVPLVVDAGFGDNWDEAH
ncbi:MAG: DNA polymerase I [Proteobacteria bacterium]|nr:DNA polymerase I [Pseudomonadota bacterium]